MKPAVIYNKYNNYNKYIEVQTQCNKVPNWYAYT